ncbi:MAG: CHAT domain-containing protein [Kofleriaceae bacterium]
MAADPQKLGVSLRRWWIAPIALLSLAGKFYLCAGERETCAAAVRFATVNNAVRICAEEYARSGVPETGAHLANLYRRSDDPKRATELARKLTTTPAEAEAQYVLGKIAIEEQRASDAQHAFARAVELHTRAENWSKVARSLHGWSEVFLFNADYAGAIEVLSRAITAAHRAGDTYIEGYCHLTIARMLSRIGNIAGARATLAKAEGEFSTDLDRSIAVLEQGNLEQEAGNHHQAAEFFERALKYATSAHYMNAVQSAQFNLTESLAALGRTKDAAHWFAKWRSTQRPSDLPGEVRYLEAKIAETQGDHQLAASLLDDALALTAPDDLDDIAKFTLARASVGLKLDSSSAAADWATRSASLIEQIRNKQEPLEFRSWITARYREIYELWFLGLAQANRQDEAVMALERWQARATLDALTPNSPRGEISLDEAASEARTLSRAQAALKSRVNSAPLSSFDLNAQLTGTEVFALIVARGEIWSMSVHRGGTHLAKLGELRDLTARYLDSFRERPTDVTLAEKLGNLLLPTHFFRKTSAPLRLLLDEPLATIPFEALRLEGRPLIAYRPVIRILRPSHSACIPRDNPREAVFIADASGDLPSAKREAEAVARQRDGVVHVGPGATIAALQAAGAAHQLHLAVHSTVDDMGGALVLHDGVVRAIDIAARGHGPARVILATCASAVAQEGNYSLAMAFLTAGAQQVVATLRPVTDEGAAEVMREFYRRGGAEDPVHALASAQAALATTRNLDWPYFSAFGREFCSNSR